MPFWGRGGRPRRARAGNGGDGPRGWDFFRAGARIARALGAGRPFCRAFWGAAAAASGPPRGNLNNRASGRRGVAWKRVADRGSVPRGGSAEFVVDGRRIALINSGGGMHAVDAVCAHQEQSIAGGRIEGDVIECPHHFWHYNYKSGRLLDYLKGVSLGTYGAEERGDGIYVDV